MARTATSRRILPVSLLLEGRPCLVVGGGRIAERKVGHLLEAGARLTVVCTRASPRVEQLAKAGKVRLIRREFRPADVHGAFLLFAATDSDDVNRRVIQCGKAQKSLCCSAGSNWPEGDFMTPAIIRQSGLTLAVATGGESCRRSRLVKDALARRLSLLVATELMLVEAPWTDSRNRRGAARCLNRIAPLLMQVGGIHEFALLQIGDRVGLMAVVCRSPALEEAVLRLLSFWPPDRKRGAVAYGCRAFERLAARAAGSHVAAAIERALERAVASGWAGLMLQQWIPAAVRAASEIRPAASSRLTRRKEYEAIARSFECWNAEQ